MNNSKIVFIVNQAARLIKASYDGPTSDVKVAGTPFKTLDPSIKVDDLVIVETSTRHGFTVVKVTEVDLDVDFDSTEELRWAFNPLDLAGFQELKAAEQAAIEKVRAIELKKKRAALQAAMFADDEEAMNQLKLASPTISPGE